MVEGLDQERTAPAGRVDDLDILQFDLPGLPESDQGLSLRLVEGLDVIGLGVFQRGARRIGHLGVVSLPKSFLF